MRNPDPANIPGEYNAPVSTSNNPDRLCGSVERITFHSDETGFSVLRM